MKQAASIQSSVNPTLSSLGPSGDACSGQQQIEMSNGSKPGNREQGKI
jgi:hypothetical protein